MKANFVRKRPIRTEGCHQASDQHIVLAPTWNQRASACSVHHGWLPLEEPVRNVKQDLSFWLAAQCFLLTRQYLIGCHRALQILRGLLARSLHELNNDMFLVFFLLYLLCFAAHPFIILQISWNVSKTTQVGGISFKVTSYLAHPSNVIGGPTTEINDIKIYNKLLLLCIYCTNSILYVISLCLHVGFLDEGTMCTVWTWCKNKPYSVVVQATPAYHQHVWNHLIQRTTDGALLFSV